MDNKQVWLSLGSNISRRKSILSALSALEENFSNLTISPIYETTAVGFEGANFYNLVVGFKSDKPLSEIAKICRDIEEDNGRVRQSNKFSARTLDIDILTWGDTHGVIDNTELPRDEILKYAFVLKPLADVAPNEKHPERNQTYLDLWENFSDKPQDIKKVTL